MARELCLIHANCQGDALKQILEASPAFAKSFEIRHLRNYEKKHLEQGLLDSASIFIHQHLTEKWGEISTSEVLPRLPASTQVLCMPNCFFKGYWPFWQNCPETIDFSDSLLESLLARGLDDTAILHIYLKADEALSGDAMQIALASLAKEREKEIYSPIKYVEIIEENWQKKQLFLTINHPGVELLLHIGSEILRILGLRPFPKDFAASFVSPHNEFWLPIHPVIGKRLKLPFVATDRRYPCFGADLTFREYIAIYLACRRNGIFDLPSTLASHALAQAKKAH